MGYFLIQLPSIACLAHTLKLIKLETKVGTPSSYVDVMQKGMFVMNLQTHTWPQGGGYKL